MDARGRLSNFGASDGRCERLCDVLQFCSPTSLQSRFASCFNKNNLLGTVELVDHYREIHLPKGMVQTIQIDLRGQRYDLLDKIDIQNKINTETKGLIDGKNIQFLEDR